MDDFAAHVRYPVKATYMRILKFLSMLICWLHVRLFDAAREGAPCFRQ